MSRTSWVTFFLISILSGLMRTAAAAAAVADDDMLAPMVDGNPASTMAQSSITSKMLRGVRLLDEEEFVNDAAGLATWLIIVIVVCAVLCCLASIALCVFCELLDVVMSCLCCRKP